MVPFLLRTAQSVTPTEWRTSVDAYLRTSAVAAPMIFDSTTGQPSDALFCIAVWFLCFAVFAVTFEAEARWYVEYAGAAVPSWQIVIFSAFACCVLLPLLHNNYIYDPPTVALSMLALRAVRLERFFELVLLTALFSCNRETAFIVPAITFFYWLHRGRPGRAFQQAAVLAVVYFCIAGVLIYRYRHNAGTLAQDHFTYLMDLYTHKKAPYAVAALLGLALYTLGVIRAWKLLPASLKAVQWTVPFWVALHIRYGWPMEWRVFLEIYPGVMLTSITLWALHRAASAGRAPAEAVPDSIVSS
jgi:hypothetical protein